MVDPTGDLAAKVKADYQLGQRIPVDHTPTIYVVSDSARGTPFVEVVDRTQLYQLIEQVMKEAGDTPQEHKSAAAQKHHEVNRHLIPRKLAPISELSFFSLVLNMLLSGCTPPDGCIRACITGEQSATLRVEVGRRIGPSVYPALDDDCHNFCHVVGLPLTGFSYARYS